MPPVVTSNRSDFSLEFCFKFLQFNYYEEYINFKKDFNLFNVKNNLVIKNKFQRIYKKYQSL